LVYRGGGDLIGSAVLNTRLGAVQKGRGIDKREVQTAKEERGRGEYRGEGRKSALVLSPFTTSREVFCARNTSFYIWGRNQLCTF